MNQATTERDARRIQLRTQLKQDRGALSATKQSAYSQIICDRALPLLKNFAHIAFYFKSGAEVDLASLIINCEQSGQHCYVPIVQPHYQMSFAPVNGNTPVVTNRYGIDEPDISIDNLVCSDKLDAVVVPMVGFDDQCNRMGMGGGYYDRCFAHRQQRSVTKPMLIGVAYELQHATNIFAQQWDVPLDYVLTEQRVVARS